MRKVFQILLIIGFFTFQACMDEPEIKPDTNKGNFDALWEIIDKQYCYLDYKNIDWRKIYNVYYNGLDTVKNDYQLFDLMATMLGELKDGHVNLYSTFDRSRYWKWFTNHPDNFYSELIFGKHYLSNDYRIAGSLRYKAIANKQIGYIYYGSFSNGFSDANMRAIFQQFASCKGLIIDIRNNGGGLLSNSKKMASYFFTKKTLTGYITHKTGDGHSDFSTPKPIYTEQHKTVRWQKPIVILINRSSYSAANDFICRMQYAPYATLTGDVSGGGGGIPMSSELPNGWMVRFSSSPMLDAKKQQIEWGIAPDLRIDIKPTDRANGYDTIIETAIVYLLNS